MFVIVKLSIQKLDARKVHMALVGFLEKKTLSFVKDLWVLLADAQSNPTGVPSVILEKKKSEIQKRNEEKERVRSERETRPSQWHSHKGSEGDPSHDCTAIF